jgi:ankyrin repeat protein
VGDNFGRTDVINQIAAGRTDLVFDYIGEGHSATSKDGNGTSLIEWCGYYGDVSAIKFLINNGESLHSLGDNYGLNAAAFHGHWRLCQYLIENGADVNLPLAETGETPLHAALCSTRAAQNLVVKVLLAKGADPNRTTKPSVETGAFMRDCRTRAETPLHRAAAFATEDTIQLLLDGGSKVDAKDMNGDSPLTWASWSLRADSVLRKLCYGTFSIRPERRSMDIYLLGNPNV